MQKNIMFKPISAPLSVLLISPYPNVHGGVAAFAETLKKHLINCKIYSLHVGNKGELNENTLIKCIRLATTLLKLVILVRKQDFDVVHLNPSLNTKSLFRDGMILFMLRILRFRRVLVYFHGWDWAIEKCLRQSPWKRRIFVSLLNRTARILVLAPEFRESLMDMGVGSNLISCTCTLFDENMFEGVSPAEPFSRTILYMSRFDAQKGMYELLSAFACIAAEFPDTRLIFAGDGKEKGRLQAHAGGLGLGDRVSFTGYVRDKEKAELLLGCTLFALPTYFAEGMPVALLEAMAAGKPLLTANAGGIMHIIHEPENGIILNVVSEETVAEALRRLLRDPGYCRKTGARNRTYAWKTFAAKIVAKNIEGIYRDL